VVSAYGIAFGGLVALAGRAADLLGRRRVFRAGTLLFATASLFCAFACSPAVRIAARAVQGLGAAIVSPSALSILMTTFREGAERN
jgi:MFS family permease